MKTIDSDKKSPQQGELSPGEKLGEIVLILLSAGVLVAIYLWIVVLA